MLSLRKKRSVYPCGAQGTGKTTRTAAACCLAHRAFWFASLPWYGLSLSLVLSIGTAAAQSTSAEPATVEPGASAPSPLDADADTMEPKLAVRYERAIAQAVD